MEQVRESEVTSQAGSRMGDGYLQVRLRMSGQPAGCQLIRSIKYARNMSNSTNEAAVLRWRLQCCGGCSSAVAAAPVLWPRRACEQCQV